MGIIERNPSALVAWNRLLRPSVDLRMRLRMMFKTEDSPCNRWRVDKEDSINQLGCLILDVSIPFSGGLRDLAVISRDFVSRFGRKVVEDLSYPSRTDGSAGIGKVPLLCGSNRECDTSHWLGCILICCSPYGR